MDEPAGDHRLLQGDREGGPVAEDHAQHQGGLRLGKGAVNRAHQPMADGEERGVQRVARVGRVPDQPGRRHHAGDPLLGKVRAVVELVEGRRRLEAPAQQDEVPVVDRNPAVDGRLDPQGRDLPEPRHLDVVDSNRQPGAATPRLRIVIHRARHGHVVGAEAGGQRHRRGHCGPSHAERHGKEGQQDDRPQPRPDHGDQHSNQDDRGDERHDRAQQHERHDAGTEAHEEEREGPPRQPAHGTVSDFASCL